MKRSWNVWIGLLVMAMMLAIAGCGGGSQSGGSDDSGDTKITKKFEGVTVKAKSYAFVGPDNPAIYAAIKEFEDKYGGKVEWEVIGWGQDHKLLPAAVAAGDVWDLQYAEAFQVFPTWMSEGLIQPIEPYVDLKDPMFNGALAGATYRGKVYGVRPIEAQGPYVVNYNKTLFQEMGVKTPYEYYKEGNWNYNTMMDIMIKMTKDTDGDGKPDIYGINYHFGVLYNLIVSNGGYVVKIKEDGTLESVWDSPNNREALQFMQDMFFKNKVAMSTTNEREQMFYARKYALYPEAPLTLKLKPNADHKDELGFVPWPAGPSTNGKYITPINYSYWVIPAGAKNPQAAGVLAMLISKYEKDLNYNRVKDALKDNPEQMKVYDEILANIAPDVRQKIPGIKMPSMGEIYNDGKPVATTIAEQNAQLQAQINEYNAKVKK